MNSPQLTYYDMGAGVVAFSTTRHGGCSTGNYAAFNINNYCGDLPAHTTENRQQLAGVLDIPENHIIMPHQTHRCHVVRIDTPPTEVIEDTDAVMTDVRGLCVGVSTADCIPILLYDREHHAVCAVHAGWRGTVQRIVGKAADAMGVHYGTVPAHVKAVVGPGISLDSFEVGDEVYEQFQQAGFDMERISRRDARWHIDLPACNALQLREMGVSDIQMTGICTYQQVDTYFSARRLGINSGRIYTAILLK